MRPKNLVHTALLVFLGTGCQGPVSNVTIPSSTPALVVLNAPSGAILYVDSKSMGEASLYNGDPNVLEVQVGTHIVEIRLGDKLLRSEKVFFGGVEKRFIRL